MEATFDRRRGDPLMQRFGRTIGSASMLLAAYFLLNIVLRATLPHSLELDEAEQTFYAQYLLGGYGPQPPFYNWLQYAVVSVTGPSIWALSIPKNILLFLCYVFYGLAAREVLKDRALQAAAMLALITLPQVSYMAQQDLTHTVALLFATSMFLFGFFRTLERPSLLSYLILGIATGIGIISKYNFALMPLIAIATVIPDREWRRRILDWRIVPAFAVALAITSPHLLWLYGNVELASRGTLNKMIDSREAGDLFPAGKGLLSLLIAIVAFAALPIAIFAAAFRRDFVHALSAGDRWTRLMGRMIVISLIAIVAVIMVTGATHIRERWLDPFLLILPIYIFCKLEVAGGDLSLGLKRFLNVVPVLMALVLIALAARVTGAEFIGSYTKLNVPFADFAKAMTDNRQPPALILASDRYVGGNLQIQLPDVPVMISGFPKPRIPADAVAERPILVVWRGPNPKEAPMPPDLSAWMKDNGIEPDTIGALALPYHFSESGDTFTLGYAWLERK